VVAGFVEQKRKGREARLPFGTLENGSFFGPPEVLAREQGTSAWRAAWGRDKGLAKQDSALGDTIDVGSSYESLERLVGLELGIGARVSAIVVGEEKQEVRLLREAREA
jgi:hypothetical protein